MGTYNKYSEVEDTILRQLYATASREEILSKLPNRTWNAILRHAKEDLKLSRIKMKTPTAHTWNVEEDKFIINSISTMTINQIAEIIGVSRQQVQRRMKQLNISTKAIRQVMWTEQEICILNEHFAKAPSDYIQEMLPDKTWEQIQDYAKTHLLFRTIRDVVSVNYRFFDEWNESSAYLLGFIMADGYIDSKHNSISIELHRRDSDIIYKIALAIKLHGQLYYQKDKHTIKLHIINSRLVSQAIKKGIPVKDKSYNATFPTDIPLQYVRHFIRGLIDGDGWAQFKEFQGTVAYNVGVCGTYDIVKGVRDNLYPCCSDIKIVRNTDTNYKFNLRGKRAFKVASWLYQDATLWLDRKYNVYVQAKEKYLKE